ncbi:MAG TPA: hypothetical protein VGG75_17200 [Trebonia sp.]|jgi:hypothetical protein
MARQERLLDSCDELIQAVSQRDPERLRKALQRVASAGTTSKPEQVNAGVAKLLPVVETIEYGPGAALAKLTGALTDFGTDVTAALPVLVRRATEAMELAARLVSIYASGDGPGAASDGPADKLPDPESPDQYEQTVRWLTAGPGRLSQAEAHEMAQAWFAGGDWVQPVMHLCQRKDVRAALPDRERLTATMAAAGDHIGTAHWLYGLLQVIDDASLIVLHRPTGRGYKLTISGIGDNSQLHTLLATTLIGSERRGLLPGKKPSRAETAAASEGPDLTPRGGIGGQFGLSDGNGVRIPHEGLPAAISLLRGERVIVLDALTQPRSWNAGRSYPLMKPEITLQRHLSESEAGEWLAAVEPARASSTTS